MDTPLFKTFPQRPNVFFLAGIAMSAIALVLTVGVTLLIRDRESARDQARLDLANVNRTVARKLTDDLQGPLLSLRRIRQRLLDGQDAMPDHGMMAAAARSIPHLEAFSVIDHTGYPVMLEHAGEETITNAILAHDFGRQATTVGTADYAVGSPWLVQGDKDRLFSIQLPVVSQRGRAGQSVLAILNVDMLEHLARTSIPNHHWGITIGTADGIVYTGAPFPHEEREFRRDHPAGEVSGRAFYGRTERLFFETDIDGGAFHINVSRELADIDAAWMQRARVAAVVITLFILAIAAGAILAWKASRRRWKNHLAALRRDRAQARLADLDSLTGLSNRTRFDRDLDDAVTTADPVSLLLIDIDRLKSYNERYGRKAGDGVLQLVGRAVQDAALEVGSHASRYDSDLLAVVLPGMKQADALLLADKIRAAVIDLRIGHADGPVKKLSVSIAVATAQGRERQFLLARAFAHLAEARPNGNRVIGDPYLPVADAS